MIEEMNMNSQVETNNLNRMDDPDGMIISSDVGKSRYKRLYVIDYNCNKFNINVMF